MMPQSFWMREVINTYNTGRKKWANRPAVKRGRIVNRINGPLNEQLHERHDASDFETNMEDKRQG